MLNRFQKNVYDRSKSTDYLSVSAPTSSFWAEPAEELAECLRVLKPGGTALFYVTHPTSWLKGLAESGLFIAREPEGIERILKEVGFRHAQTHEHVLEDLRGFAVMAMK